MMYECVPRLRTVKWMYEKIRSTGSRMTVIRNVRFENDREAGYLRAIVDKAIQHSATGNHGCTVNMRQGDSAKITYTVLLVPWFAEHILCDS